MAKRFRGFLPVVVDVETGGFNCATDALLEIAIVTLEMDANGLLSTQASHAYHVRPFDGANIEKASLEVNGIDPFHPLRPALPRRLLRPALPGWAARALASPPGLARTTRKVATTMGSRFRIS